MRNLRNIARTAVQFANETPLPLTATTWDTSTDSLICAFGPSPDQASIELRRISTFDSDKRTGEHASIAEWDAQCPNPDLPCDRILSLHYFADTAVICLVLAGGDLVIVRESPLPGEELLEIVGSVDAGLKAAAWSPDEELLVLVTGDENVLFMSREFESISEVKFAREDVKLSKHVNVGWGKKETQFLGKRARALKDPTMPERVDEGVLSKHDDLEVKISWRGDGEFVAVNAVEEGVRRLMRVYSREGVLDSVSEPVDYFEGPLSWRPTGNIIAGVKRTDGDAEVIFFERNGLRHGEFKLRMGPDQLSESGGLRSLAWNVDSTVLTVCFTDRVQLWTMGNYHYYLKQEIWLPGTDRAIKGVSWHPEKPLRLAIQGETEVLILDYASYVAKGSTCSPHDHGIVAVIDGKDLKITPLRSANVPPPMALHELHLTDNVIDVAVNSKTSVIYVLTPKGVSTYTYAVGSKTFDGPKLEGVRPLDSKAGVPFQIAVFNEKPAILCYDADTNRSSIWNLFSHNENWRSGFELGSDDIRCIGNSIDNSILWAETADGHSSGFDANAPEGSPPRSIAQLPKFCPHIEVAAVGDEEIVFGLTASGSLYANHLLLVSNCTSFLVTPAHLIFTTTHHLLQFVHLTSVSELEVPPNEPETDERCRAIERGARLVTVMPSSYAVVLQMPRGNLETIFPRALVLANIRKHIEEKKYRKAFLACRNQRVDMNILHDHAPEQFMANVGLFLDQLKKVEYVDLFLSQLRDEDVSKTMYKETIRTGAQRTIANGVTNGTETHVEHDLVQASKTNRICDALLTELESRRATNLQNIVTANVCKSPPDLEGGLAVVSKLRDESEEIAEKAAEHICFLADVNQLYDAALGMYDLELTLLIAQQSQKDPKEYMPYLQGLQDMEPLRRQFTIDDDLGKYKKAMQSLYELDAFDEMKQYAEKHELYSKAIELCKYNPEKLNALMKLYADFLSSRNRFMEAGVAYEFLRDYASALSAYRQAQRWREALACATLVPVSDGELTDLAESLAEGLIESKEYQSAATIYLEYLSNVAEAARQLCRAYLFADAMRIVSLKREVSLFESVIDPGLIDGFTSTTELLADCKSQIQAQVPRLRELRLKKDRDPLAFYAGDAAAGEAGADIPDNVSLAPTDATTSAGTFMTRYTGHTNGTLNTQTTRRTSKNRRREERKRARGKKGSVYEEEYLINSIGRLIERVNSTSEETGRLVEGLVRRGMREQAVAVETAMGDVVAMCEAVVPEVWEVKAKTVEEEEREARGADAVFLDMVEGGGKKEPPIVKKFERLSLIA
jgi:elongator complex protein 1